MGEMCTFYVEVITVCRNEHFLSGLLQAMLWYPRDVRPREVARATGGVSTGPSSSQQRQLWHPITSVGSPSVYDERFVAGSGSSSSVAHETWVRACEHCPGGHGAPAHRSVRLTARLRDQRRSVRVVSHAS